MKKLSLNSGCSLLISVFGAVVPLSVAQATTQDDMYGGRWSSTLHSEASPTIYYDDLRPAPKGPQGPMRTDMIDETANSQNEPAEPARNWPENFDN